MDKREDISVLVLTYNPKIQELKRTLKSILIQQKIDVEIIISDDGSVHFPEEDIRDFFLENNFSSYEIVLNNVNEGTVKNILSGLKRCHTEYVKMISPGDLLYGKSILYTWLEYMKNENVECSFGDAIYYCFNANVLDVLKEKSHPQYIKCYKNNDIVSCAKNYLVFKDIALGANFLCKKELMTKYISEIADKVIYAEDNIYRLMLFDGVRIGYYESNVVLYEHGTGVSTSGNPEWLKKLKDDWNSTTDIIFNRDVDPFSLRKEINIVEHKKKTIIYKLYEILSVRGMLIRRFRNKFIIRYTGTDIDTQFISQILEK